MCGIAGYQGRFPESLLPAMCGVLGHRGPDGAGWAVMQEGTAVPTGFAHRRLSIIDLSERGSQPMTTLCERCGSDNLADLALTYNGEIYNFPALRAELQAAGHSFHSATDSEVLLHLYAELGHAFLGRLNGIFALALYDGRERGRPDGVARHDVLLARDGIGVKPLYVAEDAAGTLFASEMKALLQWQSLSRELDATALYQTVAYLWTPAPRTVLSAVRKVEPGEALVVRSGAVVRRWRYYELPPTDVPFTDGEARLAERLRDTIVAAVDRQMVADVPVGAFLSGGMDSSAIVAAAKLARPDADIQCYCIGFGGAFAASEGAPDDVPYARRVADRLGVPLEVIELGADSVDQLARMLYYLDEPEADPAALNALLLCERAAADGYKVMLSGAGGDDIFSGYRRHQALRFDRYWDLLPAVVRRGIARGADRRLGRWPFSMHSATVRRAGKVLSHVGLPADERMVSMFWWNSEQLRRELFSPEVLASVEAGAAAAPLLASLGRLAPGTDRLHRMLHLDTRHFLADHNLNYTDRMGMASGVEVRVPLLDLEVIDFAARIPARMKQRGSVGKSIFKKAFEADLSPEVVYRPKTGFGAPLRRWLGGELRGLVDDTLSVASLQRRGLFDARRVRRLIEEDRRGAVDGSYVIFSVLCIELWCRTFLDGAWDGVPAAGPAAHNALLTGSGR